MLQKEEVTLTTSVVELVPGDPPTIITRHRADGGNGQYKTISMQPQVSDPGLFEHMQREIKLGDNYDLILVTDWTKRPLRCQVTAFAPAKVPA